MRVLDDSFEHWLARPVELEWEEDAGHGVPVSPDSLALGDAGTGEG